MCRVRSDLRVSVNSNVFIRPVQVFIDFLFFVFKAVYSLADKVYFLFDPCDVCPREDISFLELCLFMAVAVRACVPRLDDRWKGQLLLLLNPLLLKRVTTKCIRVNPASFHYHQSRKQSWQIKSRIDSYIVLPANFWWVWSFALFRTYVHWLLLVDHSLSAFCKAYTRQPMILVPISFRMLASSLSPGMEIRTYVA